MPISMFITAIVLFILGSLCLGSFVRSTNLLFKAINTGQSKTILSKKNIFDLSSASKFLGGAYYMYIHLYQLSFLLLKKKHLSEPDATRMILQKRYPFEIFCWITLGLFFASLAVYGMLMKANA